jgi:hypothetical protein
VINQSLAGLAVGNPVISCVSADYNAIQFNLFYWHSLVSHVLYSNWTANGCDKKSSNPGCSLIFNIALSQIGVIVQELVDPEDTNQPSLDPDDLYQAIISSCLLINIRTFVSAMAL